MKESLLRALIEALESVEWVEMPDGYGSTEVEQRCPWCDGEIFQGHAPGCERQRVLEIAKREETT